jgi:hypothetical protein
LRIDVGLARSDELEYIDTGIVAAIATNGLDAQMARFRFLPVLVIFLSWVASRLLEYSPQWSEWALDVDLGCILAAIIFALLALVRGNRWNFARFTVLLALLIVGDLTAFAYRLNNVCGPGDHVIQSADDAVKLAQNRIFQARYGSHGIPGYVDEKPGYADFGQADCCTARRTRTATGVIVWVVELRGETLGEQKKRYVNALMELSNCGAVFGDSSFITAEPTR